MLNSLFKTFDNIIVFDVETTGFKAGYDEIIEIAMLRVISDNDIPVIKSELETLIQLSQGRSLPDRITQLTGITEQDLTENGVAKEEACNKIVEMLDCSKPVLAAYNAQFDLGFLLHLLSQQNKAKVLKNIKMLDVMTVYKDRKPFPHTLGDAVEAYSLEIKNAHRALGDTYLTYNVLCEMGKELDDIEHYINLFGYNPKYGISGKKISSIKYKPQGYDSIIKLYEA